MIHLLTEVNHAPLQATNSDSDFPSDALNVNYVAQGVRRFIDASHLYGKDDDGGGGMIGYVQSMDVDAIWAEVAQQLADAGLAALPKPGSHPGSTVLHSASHDLTRADAASPFRLHHFWVDLRP